MTSENEKLKAIEVALNENIPIPQLCAICEHHRICFVSKLITDVHIENNWVTLRCVRCDNYTLRRVKS